MLIDGITFKGIWFCSRNSVHLEIGFQNKQEMKELTASRAESSYCEPDQAEVCRGIPTNHLSNCCVGSHFCPRHCPKFATATTTVSSGTVLAMQHVFNATSCFSFALYPNPCCHFLFVLYRKPHGRKTLVNIVPMYRGGILFFLQHPTMVSLSCS